MEAAGPSGGHLFGPRPPGGAQGRAGPGPPSHTCGNTRGGAGGGAASDGSPGAQGGATSQSQRPSSGRPAPSLPEACPRLPRSDRDPSCLSFSKGRSAPRKGLLLGEQGRKVTEGPLSAPNPSLFGDWKPQRCRRPDKPWRRPHRLFLAGVPLLGPSVKAVPPHLWAGVSSSPSTLPFPHNLETRIPNSRYLEPGHPLVASSSGAAGVMQPGAGRQWPWRGTESDFGVFPKWMEALSLNLGDPVFSPAKWKYSSHALGGKGLVKHSAKACARWLSTLPATIGPVPVG